MEFLLECIFGITIISIIGNMALISLFASKLNVDNANHFGIGIVWGFLAGLFCIAPALAYSWLTR